jgi:hypothetical protein
LNEELQLNRQNVEPVIAMDARLHVQDVLVVAVDHLVPVGMTRTTPVMLEPLADWAQEDELLSDPATHPRWRY